MNVVSSSNVVILEAVTQRERKRRCRHAAYIHHYLRHDQDRKKPTATSEKIFEENNKPLVGCIQINVEKISFWNFEKSYKKSITLSMNDLQERLV